MSKTAFWALFGTELYLYDEGPEELDIRLDEKLLAIFSSREKAIEYVEVSKTPGFREYVDWRNQSKGKQFVKDSLLAGSTGYIIKPLEVPKLTVDPETTWEQIISG
jgi:hypothetical protein